MSKRNDNKRLRALIAEALELGVFGYQDRSGIEAPEDAMVDSLGRQIGYGALMDSASRMWAKKLKVDGFEGGEHTVAACASVRRDWCNRARVALAGGEAGEQAGGANSKAQTKETDDGTAHRS